MLQITGDQATVILGISLQCGAVCRLTTFLVNGHLLSTWVVTAHLAVNARKMCWFMPAGSKQAEQLTTWPHTSVVAFAPGTSTSTKLLDMMVSVILYRSGQPTTRGIELSSFAPGMLRHCSLTQCRGVRWGLCLLHAAATYCRLHAVRAMLHIAGQFSSAQVLLQKRLLYAMAR